MRNIFILFFVFRALFWIFQMSFKVGYSFGLFLVRLFKKKPAPSRIDVGDARSVKSP